MSCFDAITIPGLKERFQTEAKEGMTEMELRTIGTRIALEHLKDVNKRINDLRVATGLKKEKIVIDDKAKEIKEVRESVGKTETTEKPTVKESLTVAKPIKKPTSDNTSQVESKVKADSKDIKDTSTPSQIDAKNGTESKEEVVLSDIDKIFDERSKKIDKIYTNGDVLEQVKLIYRNTQNNILNILFYLQRGIYHLPTPLKMQQNRYMILSQKNF